MKAKKKRQESVAKKKQTAESWQQYQKPSKSIGVYNPMIRVHAVPRRARRGC